MKQELLATNSPQHRLLAEFYVQQGPDFADLSEQIIYRCRNNTEARKLVNRDCAKLLVPRLKNFTKGTSRAHTSDSTRTFEELAQALENLSTNEDGLILLSGALSDAWDDLLGQIDGLLDTVIRRGLGIVQRVFNNKDNLFDTTNQILGTQVHGKFGGSEHRNLQFAIFYAGLVISLE